MPRIVVVACDKGIEAAREAVDGRVVAGFLVVGEDDVEVAVQLGGSQVAEVLGDEGETDEFNWFTL